MAGNIRYIAVAVDEKNVADYVHASKGISEDYRGTLERIFESQGWSDVKSSSRPKMELTSGSSVYCLEFDGDERSRVLFAVVSNTYPTRYIFSSSGAGLTTPRLMAELKEHIQDQLSSSSGSQEKVLKRTLKTFFKPLASKYDDVQSLDKLAATTKKVQDIQRVMANNMIAASERDSLLTGLQIRSDDLKESGKKMFASAEKVRSKSRWALCRSSAACIGCFVLVIAAVVSTVVGLNYEKYHWWK